MIGRMFQRRGNQLVEVTNPSVILADASNSALTQTTFYVSPDGDDASDGLTQATAVQTFERVAELVENNIASVSHVYVAAGTYTSSEFNFATHRTVHLHLLGNVTFNGNVQVLGGGSTCLIQDAPGVTAALTVNGRLYAGYHGRLEVNCSELIVNTTDSLLASTYGFLSLAPTVSCRIVGGGNWTALVADYFAEVYVNTPALNISGTCGSQSVISVDRNSYMHLNPASLSCSATSGLFLSVAGNSYCYWYTTGTVSVSNSPGLVRAQYGGVLMATLSGATSFYPTASTGVFIAAYHGSVSYINFSGGCTVAANSNWKGTGAYANLNSVISVAGNISYSSTYHVDSKKFFVSTGAQIYSNGGGDNYFPGKTAGSEGTSSFGKYN